MSKWLNKEAFQKFEENLKTDDKKDNQGFFLKWKSPKMGTVERAKEYTLRLLPDIKSNSFYKNYFYHGFYQGEKFKYILCPKTFNVEHYCPWCDAYRVLYQGTDADKAKASTYKKQERFVGNVLIVDDPRDAEESDVLKKAQGRVLLYEFPGAVESKIKNEITDKKNGYGIEIFDPENGYDFVLKVKAKPKDKNGKEWPDYADSMFARKCSAIASSEDEIKTTLDKCYNLDDYLKSMSVTLEEQERMIKEEMLWDDIGATFEKSVKKLAVAGKYSEPKAETTGQIQEVAQQTTKKEAVVETKTSDTFDDSEKDDAQSLLDELDNM